MQRWSVFLVAILACGFVLVSIPQSLRACDASKDLFTCETQGQTESGLGIELPTLQSIIVSLGQLVVDTAFTAIDTLVNTVITGLTNSVTPNLSDFTEGLLEEEMDPDMRNMVRQWSTALMDQVRTDGALRDAHEQTKVQEEIERKAYLINRKYRVNEQNCVTGTLLGGQARVRAISKAMSTALEKNGILDDKAHLKRGKNMEGTPSAGGPVGDHVETWDLYAKYFCHGDNNRGASGSGGGCPYPNEDLEVSEEYFIPTTISLADEETRIKLEMMRRHIIEPIAPMPVPKNVVDTPDGRSTLMNVYRPALGKRAVGNYIFHDGLALKTPASGAAVGGLMKDIADAVEVPPNRVAEIPSEYEYMERLTETRYMDPRYHLMAGADPAREAIELNAIQSIQGYDTLIALENAFLAQSVRVGQRADRFFPQYANVSVEPVK